MVDMPIKLNLEKAAKRPLSRREKLDQFKDCAEGQTPVKRHSLPTRLIAAALVTAFIAAAGACTNNGQTGHPTDTNTDGDTITDTTDTDGESGPCPEPGEPLSGVDDNPLKSEFTWTATFSGVDGATTGPVTLEVGADINDGSIVWLEGECEGMQMALGKEGPIPIEPQSKLSHNPNSDSSEGFPAAPEADFCPPLGAAANNNPAEVNQSEGNVTAKNLQVGSQTVPVTLAFVDSLAPKLMVNGSEATSLALSGGFEATEVSIALPESILSLLASVSTSSGAEILSLMLESEITAALAGGELASGKARILGVGSGQSTLWDVELDTSDVTTCLRCAPHQQDVGKNVSFSIPVDEVCGATHGGLTVEDLDVTITEVTPDWYFSLFDVDSVSATSLAPMEEGPLTVTITLPKGSGFDGG